MTYEGGQASGENVSQPLAIAPPYRALRNEGKQRTKTYQAVYERDEKGLWAAHIKAVAEYHTRGRTIAQARERVREALRLFDGLAEQACLLDVCACQVT
jgi:predicted RNase H-like HicB family nuclease